MAPTSMSESDPDNKSSFVYSIKWVESIFSSRPVAEELLAPELEAGNLTSADYEKAVNFLPQAKKYAYQPIGGLILFSAISALGIRYRSPSWSTLQKITVASSLGVVGYTLGKFNRIRVHTQFLYSIENLRGLAGAISNVEARTGLHNYLTRGPKLTTIVPGRSREGQLSQKPDSSLEPSSSARHDATPRPTPSRWDEIRKANNNAPSITKWETLRQNHEEGCQTRAKSLT